MQKFDITTNSSSY